MKENAKANIICILTHVSSKQIELERPGYSGFEANVKSLKT